MEENSGSSEENYSTNRNWLTAQQEMPIDEARIDRFIDQYKTHLEQDPSNLHQPSLNILQTEYDTLLMHLRGGTDRDNTLRARLNDNYRTLFNSRSHPQSAQDQGVFTSVTRSVPDFSHFDQRPSNAEELRKLAEPMIAAAGEGQIEFRSLGEREQISYGNVDNLKRFSDGSGLMQVTIKSFLVGSKIPEIKMIIADLTPDQFLKFRQSGIKESLGKHSAAQPTQEGADAVPVRDRPSTQGALIQLAESMFAATVRLKPDFRPLRSSEEVLHGNPNKNAIPFSDGSALVQVTTKDGQRTQTIIADLTSAQYHEFRNSGQVKVAQSIAGESQKKGRRR